MPVWSNLKEDIFEQRIDMLHEIFSILTDESKFTNTKTSFFAHNDNGKKKI